MKQNRHSFSDQIQPEIWGIMMLKPHTWFEICKYMIWTELVKNPTFSMHTATHAFYLLPNLIFGLITLAFCIKTVRINWIKGGFWLNATAFIDLGLGLFIFEKSIVLWLIRVIKCWKNLDLKTDRVRSTRAYHYVITYSIMLI